MRVIVSFSYPGVDPDSKRADELLDQFFGKWDLRKLEDACGSTDAILEDVVSDNAEYSVIKEGAIK